jgi:hypothetical protein
MVTVYTLLMLWTIFSAKRQEPLPQDRPPNLA